MKEPENIIWTGKTVGICLEQYNGNYAIKACKRFESQGNERTGYDWAFPQEYNKETRQWGPRPKAAPISVYLGDKQQAARCLMKMLDSLGEVEHAKPLDDEDVPF